MLRIVVNRDSDIAEVFKNGRPNPFLTMPIKGMVSNFEVFIHHLLIALDENYPLHDITFEYQDEGMTKMVDEW